MSNPFRPLAQFGPLAADGLSLAIGALTLFVAGVVIAFSLRYMRADRRRGSYFAMVGALVSAVLGFALAANLVLLGLAWVISGVLLARLIGHAEGLADAGKASWRAALSFALGDAALIGALTILGVHAGSWRIDAALAGVATLRPILAVLVGLLLLVAAAVRSALPPFSGWLLSSMTAPTPVSALMHAGLVNAGGFLLIRFAPVFEAAAPARAAGVALGLIAAFYGIGVMAVRPDIKRSLAGSTVSQMGFMILSCAVGAYAAALWHVIAHGLFKAWLFLGSGSAVGIRDNATPAPATRVTLPIAAVTLAAAAAALITGRLTGGFVPLLLAAATAVATMAGAARAGRGKVRLIAVVLALVAINGAGLALAHAAIGADGPALLSPAALLVLLAGFLAAWVWQQARLARATPLPPRLYVFLLNAGA